MSKICVHHHVGSARRLARMRQLERVGSPTARHCVLEGTLFLSEQVSACPPTIATYKDHLLIRVVQCCLFTLKITSAFYKWLRKSRLFRLRALFAPVDPSFPILTQPWPHGKLRKQNRLLP